MKQRAPVREPRFAPRMRAYHLACHGASVDDVAADIGVTPEIASNLIGAGRAHHLQWVRGAMWPEWFVVPVRDMFTGRKTVRRYSVRSNPSLVREHRSAGRS